MIVAPSISNLSNMAFYGRIFFKKNKEYLC